MSCRRSMLAGAVLGTLLLCSGGCMMAMDMLNPDVFSAFGIDPGTIYPSPGTVIVLFTNSTNALAFFTAFEAADAADLSRDARNFSVDVDPVSSRNEVLTCPVGVVAPGSLDAAFAIQTQAVTVFDAAGTTNVDYNGAPLTSPHDFSCGDVIEIQLIQVGTAYQLLVQVRPS